MKRLAQILLITKFYLLQIFLGVSAYVAGNEAMQIGHLNNHYEGTFQQIYLDDYHKFYPTDVSAISGWNGGAIAMGIICSTCIVMIVWLEIKKMNQYEK